MKPRLLMLLFVGVLAGRMAAQPLAITHVTLIDTISGATQPDMTVVIRDGRIASAGHAAPPRGIRVVNGTGKFLIPGLWDMHVHLSWTTSSALPVLIANGVTTVRDLGSDLAEIDDWRTRIAAGILVGPRIFRAGPILNGKKFNKYQLVAGNAEEARAIARTLHQVGVDVLKVHRRMPRDSYLALLDEAKTLGLTVVGHIPMTVTPAEASNLGQATIEHVATLFEGTFSANLKSEDDLVAAVARFRETDADALFSTFVGNGTVVDPTIVAYDIPGVVAGFRHSDPLLRYVAASERALGETQLSKMTPEALDGEGRMFVQFIEVVRRMNRDGVTLVTGTDIAGPRVPGFTLHEELELLVRAGLTPLQALQAATITPATVFHRQKDLGSIEAGKVADLVLLDGNPLLDICNTRRIAAVVVNGRLLKRAALDQLLREGEALAAKH